MAHAAFICQDCYAEIPVTDLDGSGSRADTASGFACPECESGSLRI